MKDLNSESGVSSGKRVEASVSGPGLAMWKSESTEEREGTVSVGRGGGAVRRRSAALEGAEVVAVGGSLDVIYWRFRFYDFFCFCFCL